MSSSVRLYSTAAQRRRHNEEADLWEILVAVEAVERAYVRDAVSREAYEAACLKLISQWRSAESVLRHADVCADTAAFIAKYGMDVPRATERLLVSGLPATALDARTDDRSDAVRVAETVQVRCGCCRYYARVDSRFIALFLPPRCSLQPWTRSSSSSGRSTTSSRSCTTSCRA